MENKKRCPKCGEENPSDAVMCWACYTPLSGSAVSKDAQASQKSSAQSRDDDDGDGGKASTPPWQIAVIAIGLIFALFTVGKNFLPSGSSSDDTPAATEPATRPPKGDGAPAPVQTTTSTSNSGDSTSIPAPQKLPFTIVVSPNPNIAVGTMAIVATDTNISAGQAAGLATFIRSQFTQMKRWSKLYIYVFRDQQSAKQFANYQVKRSGSPLTDNDYRNLTSLWRSAVACYEYNNGSEKILTPVNNPSGWWAKL